MTARPWQRPRSSVPWSGPRNQALEPRHGRCAPVRSPSPRVRGRLDRARLGHRWGRTDICAALGRAPSLGRDSAPRHGRIRDTRTGVEAGSAPALPGAGQPRPSGPVPNRAPASCRARALALEVAAPARLRLCWPLVGERAPTPETGPRRGRLPWTEPAMASAPSCATHERGRRAHAGAGMAAPARLAQPTPAGAGEPLGAGGSARLAPARAPLHWRRLGKAGAAGPGTGAAGPRRGRCEPPARARPTPGRRRRR